MSCRMTASALVAACTMLAPISGSGQTDPLAGLTEMIEAGELETAERALRELLSRGENPAARDLLGTLLGRQDRWEEAAVEFQAAIRAAPEALGPRQRLARVRLTQGRQSEAAEALRAAARLGALDRDLGLALASIEIGEGNFQGAEKQLRETATHHRSVRALVELARLQTRREDHEAALSTLREALSIAPDSEVVLRAHAEVALAAGAPIATVWSLEPLTRMHPTEVDYPYLLGATRLQVGDSVGATEALERALELDPDRALTLIGLGLAYNNQKRFSEASEVLTRALRLAPDNVEALAALSQADEGLDRLERAEENARRALALAAGHPLAHQVVGMVRMKQGRYEEARDAFLRSLEASPESVKAHYQLSLAFARLGDRDSSQRHLELYRTALKRMEEALLELSTRTGASADDT